MYQMSLGDPWHQLMPASSAEFNLWHSPKWCAKAFLFIYYAWDDNLWTKTSFQDILLCIYLPEIEMPKNGSVIIIPESQWAKGMRMKMYTYICYMCPAVMSNRIKWIAVIVYIHRRNRIRAFNVNACTTISNDKEMHTITFSLLLWACPSICIHMHTIYFTHTHTHTYKSTNSPSERQSKGPRWDNALLTFV